jgi:hypothetical protein
VPRARPGYMNAASSPRAHLRTCRRCFGQMP